MKMRTVIPCDIGASGGKLFLATFDGERLTLEELHRFINRPISLNGALYWDILHLNDELRQGLLKARASGVSSLGIDSMSNDYVLLDRTGALLELPHTYRDPRTLGMVERMGEYISARELYRLTGLQFNRMNTLYQWLHMCCDRPEVLSVAKSVLFLPDALSYFLTGEMQTEYTLASVSQAYAPKEKDWAYPLLQKIGFPAGLLRPIVPSGTNIGHIGREEGNGLPVFAVGGHDTASAVAAVPVRSGRFAYISSGTWSIVGTECDSPLISARSFYHGLANEGGVLDTIRLLKNVMGLWIIQECRRCWAERGKRYTYAELAALAAQAPACGPVFDPDDECFYQPSDMPARIREYVAARKMKPPETVGETARCVFESLACKYRYVLESLEFALGETLPVIHIVGGGANNEILNQLTASVAKKPVYAGPLEATALGNALMQLVGLGELSSLGEARELVMRSFPLQAYFPENDPCYEELYTRFLRVTALKEAAPKE
ncbi:MAG TPA: rhamnulokinase family protein, partial [Feifaniaceae bacterium]|nr:rhamnulokinase family protein [Feifaniaceae bacterium]